MTAAPVIAPERPRRWSRVVVALLLVGCAASLPRSQQDDESALFQLVVGAVRDSSQLALRVDPVPVRPDPSVMMPEDLERVSIPPAFAAARTRALAVAGVHVVDAFTLLPCAGVQLPLDTLNVHRGCPKQRESIAVVSLSRSGGAAFPLNGRTVSAESGSAAALRTVRVFLQERGAAGSVTRIYDYECERRQQRWALKRRVLLLIVE